MAEMKVRQVNMPSLKPRRSSIWRVNDVVKTLSKNLTAGGMEVLSVSNNNNELSTTTQENDELNFFNDIKREAEVLCMMEVRNHLMEYVNSHPSSTYEEWIGKLHPDNVNQKHPHLIDHRFYVEDSDHRRLWNINLTRGGGKRSYVHAKTGDDLSLRWDSLLKGSAESKEGEYAPLFYETLDIVEEHEDEHALLDVDVSNPFDLSLLERDQKMKENLPKPNNIQRNTTLVTQAETVSIYSNDDPNGTHHRNNNAAHDDDDNDDHSISSYNPPDPLYNERTQVMSTVDSSNHSSVCSFTSKDKENDITEKPRRTSMSSENPYNHDYLHEKDHPDDDSTCDFFHHPHIYQPDPFDTVNQPDPFEDLGFDDDEDYGTTTTTHSNIIYPSSFPHDADSSATAVTDRKSSSQQDNSPSHNNKREKRSLHPPPIYNTIETRDHLMSYIAKHPKCTYEQWIGNLYPHVVSVNKTTQEVIIYDHEECFYDESSSFRVNWNINLAKGFGEEDGVGGGGRRLYVVSREYDDED